MTDAFLRFVNCVEAYRMRTFTLNEGLGGALGIAAEPLPYQLATVRNVLGSSTIRHLISDEVGLGKTVQALMIVNALRVQDARHRTLIVLPDNLLSQWQDECWTKAHVMPALVGTSDFNRDDMPAITLVRPRDLTIRDDEGVRVFQADSQVFDLLIIDEPQTMPRDVAQTISQMTDNFRQVLVLSATPRLADTFWHNWLMRILEPDIFQLAQLESRVIDKEREADAGADSLNEPTALPASLEKLTSERRIIRNSRSDWGDHLPRRRNHQVRVQPLQHERLRIKIARTLIRDADPGQGFRGPKWTAAKSLQRSARAARPVLAELTEQEGELGETASMTRQLTLDDPGDSKLSALLDILATQWAKQRNRTFIVVCDDNLTIDLLCAALPRYFPELENSISVLRRPAAGEMDRIANLREMQTVLAPLNSGESRLLLIGDWVQAGLNLHQISSSLIFFALPWEIDSLDQLIGRIDRRGGGWEKANGQRQIDIWRILVEGSQEAAVADCMAALNVFDSPLPPLSPDHLRNIQELLARAAMAENNLQDRARLSTSELNLQTTVPADSSATASSAKEFYTSWLQHNDERSSLATGIKGPTPIARKEKAIRKWFKNIDRAGDFDFSFNRYDRVSGYRFSTLWYHKDPSGRAGKIPFPLPGVNHDRWISDHLPFISYRQEVSSPPRRAVLTDKGENTPRPLHFLDDGDVVFDSLVSGYLAKAATTFGKAQSLAQTVIMLPKEHPALALGSSTVLLTLAHLDPFPDEFLPGLWSAQARELLASAPTEAQRTSLLADRKALMDRWRAIQRVVRFSAPAQVYLTGSLKTGDGWRLMTRNEIETCLQPLVKLPDRKITVRGMTPQQPLITNDLARVLRTKHDELVANAADAFQKNTVQHSKDTLAFIKAQTLSAFDATFRNRTLKAEQRRSRRPEGVPEELWRGQIAALDRLCVANQLGATETVALISDFMSGKLRTKKNQTISILAGLRCTE